MSLRYSLHTKKGFSLVELMSATAISLFMATAFYAAFFGMRNQFAQQDNYYMNNRGVRFALDRMARDAEEALCVTYTWGADTRANNVLILKLPSINASNEPSNISTQFDYVTYKLSGTNLTRTLDVQNSSTREGGADISGKVIAKNVSTLLFSYNGTALSTYSSSTITALKKINASITSQGTVRGKTQTTQSDADLMLRNNIT